MDGFEVPLCFRLQTAVRPMAALCFLQERGIRMTEKELRRLGRGDLLDLLLEQSRENQHLREQLSDAQNALADKTICIDQAGSIAEASLRLNGVFEAAEQACRQYTENIIRLHQRQEAHCAEQEKESRERAAQIIADAQKQAEEIKDLTQQKRVRYRKRYKNVLRSTVYTMVVVAAAAVLAATIWLPVLQIYGASMNPTLDEGDIVVAVKGSGFQQGDLVAFYIGNKILVKRVIAGPGQLVDIDEDGNVYVDGQYLDEPYLAEKSLGDANIDLPYQVPDNRYFCMGDHRSTSVDSRHTEIGCVSEEQIVGKIVFRVWPFASIGTVK